MSLLINKSNANNNVWNQGQDKVLIQLYNGWVSIEERFSFQDLLILARKESKKYPPEEGYKPYPLRNKKIKQCVDRLRILDPSLRFGDLNITRRPSTQLKNTDQQNSEIGEYIQSLGRTSPENLSDQSKFMKEYLTKTLVEQGYVILETLDHGDCFYDAVAQTLSIILGEIITIKDVRATCFQYIDDLHKRDEDNSVKQALAGGCDDSYDIFRKNIQYTKEELDENGKGAPVWGDSTVARIVSEAYQVKLVSHNVMTYEIYNSDDNFLHTLTQAQDTGKVIQTYRNSSGRHVAELLADQEPEVFDGRKSKVGERRTIKIANYQRGVTGHFLGVVREGCLLNNNYEYESNMVELPTISNHSARERKEWTSEQDVDLITLDDYARNHRITLEQALEKLNTKVTDRGGSHRLIGRSHEECIHRLKKIYDETSDLFSDMEVETLNSHEEYSPRILDDFDITPHIKGFWTEEMLNEILSLIKESKNKVFLKVLAKKIKNPCSSLYGRNIGTIQSKINRMGIKTSSYKTIRQIKQNGFNLHGTPYSFKEKEKIHQIRDQMDKHDVIGTTMYWLLPGRTSRSVEKQLAKTRRASDKNGTTWKTDEKIKVLTKFLKAMKENKDEKRVFGITNLCNKIKKGSGRTGGALTQFMTKLFASKKINIYEENANKKIERLIEKLRKKLQPANVDNYRNQQVNENSKRRGRKRKLTTERTERRKRAKLAEFPSRNNKSHRKRRKNAIYSDSSDEE